MELIREGVVDAAELLWRGDPHVLSAAATTLWVSAAAAILAAAAGTATGSSLARCRLPGIGIVVLAFRAGMSVPTVLIGLLCYALFSRRGPLGALELLYTPYGMIAGQFLLAFPIVVALTHGAVTSLDPRVFETARTLGAGPLRRWRTYVSEARVGVSLAVLTAFARCLTELGIALMVGGNIKFRTRTLTTATALETARGEFARGVAMSLILLLLATAATVAVGWLARAERNRR